ncbi:PIG-L deacetylase family protein [Pengzhenrongella sicca]|uniref:PIG-L family deacetylase n=1 Tax=Pengzhenrongella sicca TaxID=2819238 RepID=A0A8A4ZDJ3_9MICO|nr:PIG-L family deacetylase [Pengzhenrongella sicca]QTE27778.1 PIG-L family deacetylase [Pengzhenrongella sicca]
MSPTLAACFAHPDDEAYCTYASVALHCAEPTFRLAVLLATDGEAGEVAPGLEVGPDGLGALRREEDARAWRSLGYSPDRQDWLGLPDGALAEVPFDGLVSSVATFLDAERPDVVVTFGPDGLTGHPDHVAIGAATDAAFHAVRRDGGPGLRRLLHPAIADSWFARHQAWRRANGHPPWDPDRIYHLRSVEDSRIGVDVRTAAVAHRLLAGLKEHRSQRHVMLPAVDDDTFVRGATHETHVVVWPPRAPTEPPLHSIFEGLD